MSSLNTKDVDGVLVVSFPDVRLADESRIYDLGKQFSDLIVEHPNSNFVLDFDGVRFMSSSMIGKIIYFSKSCEDNGNGLAMCGLSDDLLEVFQVMNLEKQLNICSSESAAIKAVSKKKKWYLRRK